MIAASDKEFMQLGRVRPGDGVVWDVRGVPLLVTQDYRNAIHHLLALQKRVEIK